MASSLVLWPSLLCGLFDIVVWNTEQQLRAEDALDGNGILKFLAGVEPPPDWPKADCSKTLQNARRLRLRWLQLLSLHDLPCDSSYFRRGLGFSLPSSSLLLLVVQRT